MTPRLDNPAGEAVDPLSHPRSTSVVRPANEEPSRPNLKHALVGGAIWTLGGYGLSQAIRFATSMALTRLLAPELFGIMLIINTVRTGVELLSDIGISQSIIRSPKGDDPEFYRTAWTLQICRGFLIAVICAIAAIPVALVYDLSAVTSLLPVAALTLVISGFTSVALPLSRRRFAFRRLAIFEVLTAAGYSIFQIGLAYFFPNVWALVLGLIIGSVITAAGSYALIRNLGHRLLVDRPAFAEIFGFGKWITASSSIFFVTSNFDRIFLPTVMTLHTLGIYAIARTITDIVSSLFVRLNNSILFPLVANYNNSPSIDARKELSPARIRVLAGSAVVVGALAGSVDLMVTVLFDSRYRSAGEIASLLMLGGWFSVLAHTAETSLMALGRPQAATLANGAKLLWLVFALPWAYAQAGTPGAISAIVASELVRYLATIPAQRRASFLFVGQDAGATALMIAVAGLVLGTKSLLGLSAPELTLISRLLFG